MPVKLKEKYTRYLNAPRCEWDPDLYEIRDHIARHGLDTLNLVITYGEDPDTGQIQGFEVCSAYEDANQRNKDILWTLSNCNPYRHGKDYLDLGLTWGVEQCQTDWPTGGLWRCPCGDQVHRKGDSWVTVEVVCDYGLENRWNGSSWWNVEYWWHDFHQGIHDEDMEWYYGELRDEDSGEYEPLVLPEKLFYVQQVHNRCLGQFFADVTGGIYHHNFYADGLSRARHLDRLPGSRIPFSRLPSIF